MKHARASGVLALLRMLIISLFLVAGCVQREKPARPTGSLTSRPTQTVTPGKCGDGVCDDREREEGLCPCDCPSEQPTEPTVTPTPAPVGIDYSMRFGIGGYIHPDIKRDDVRLYRCITKSDQPVFVAGAKSPQIVDLSQYIGKETVLVTHIVEDRSTTSPETERARADSIELSESPIFIE